MRGEPLRGEHDLDRRPDLDLARELPGLRAVCVADDLLATAPTATRPGTELASDTCHDVVEGGPAGAQEVEPPLQIGR